MFEITQGQLNFLKGARIVVAKLIRLPASTASQAALVGRLEIDLRHLIGQCQVSGSKSQSPKKP